MALYTPPSSGDFNPYLKYNAKAGRFYFKPQGGEETEVQNPVFIADFDNIKKAWMKFAEGMAPDIVYCPSLTDEGPKPSDGHKIGLEVLLYSQNLFGGVAEFASNSINTCKGLSDVYAIYEEQKGANAGKVPVVAFVEAKPVKNNHGTNYEPVFRIEKWVDRPEELTAEKPVENVSASVETVEPAPAVAAGGSEF